MLSKKELRLFRWGDVKVMSNQELTTYADAMRRVGSYYSNGRIRSTWLKSADQAEQELERRNAKETP